MKTTPLALAVALAALPTISAAQMLEEVIVTAQKKDETLTEAPVAVSVVSGDSINDLSIFEADELSKLVPGLAIQSNGAGTSSVGVRGVGTFAKQTAPARVGTYMDDYYMAAQASVALSSMFDMANVQALKGPQGTLYGQPSPTGALILTTQDPNFDGVNGYVRGSVVDPKGYNVEGAINFPVTDTLAFRIAGLVDERETGTEVKRDPATGNPLGNHTEERNRSGIRAKMLWEPTDTLMIKLGYHYLESDDSDAYSIVESFDRDETNFDLKAKDRISVADAETLITKKEDTLATLKIDWAIGDMDLSWFTGMMSSDTYTLDDNDQTDIPNVTVDLATEFGGGSDGIQHEVQLAGSAFDSWDWIVGAYYGKGASESDVRSPAGVAGGAST